MMDLDDDNHPLSAHRMFVESRLGTEWEAYAERAWFTAYVLWEMCPFEAHEEIAQKLGVKGPTLLALNEAFEREAALALELIAKAAIAKRMRDRNEDPVTAHFPTNHDVPKLWAHAKLPALSAEDNYRLHLAKSLLIWAGRYPTPKTAKDLQNEFSELKKVEPPWSAPTLANRLKVVLDWPNFDRLFRLARKQLD